MAEETQKVTLKRINKELKREKLTMEEISGLLEELRELHRQETEAETRKKLESELADYTGQVAGYILQGITCERQDADNLSGIYIPGLERVLDELPEGLKVRVTFEIYGIATEADEMDAEWSGNDFEELIVEDGEDSLETLSPEEAQAVADKWDREHDDTHEPVDTIEPF